MSEGKKSLSVAINMQTKQSEKNIDRLEKKLNDMAEAMNQIERNTGRANRYLHAIASSQERIANGNKRIKSTANEAEVAFKELKKKIGDCATTIRRLVVTAMALGSIKAVALNVVDPVTQAENKFNTVFGRMSDNPYDESGGFNPAILNQTQKTLDKIYTASQQARMGYNDMITNVSKAFSLATKAFHNNIDEAIEFNRIMGEAYTLGGASASETAQSMYQLIQALGSGILQGDELKSVREGASVAYQEIEKFVQGLYNTKESLSKLASEGKVTSDIVVEAILNSGKQLDKEYEHTKMTFGQLITVLANTGQKAFEPVFQLMAQGINGEDAKKVIDGVASSLTVVANVTYHLMTLLGNVASFMIQHWDFFGSVVLGFVTASLIKSGMAIGLLLQKALQKLGLLTSSWFWLAIVIGLVAYIVTYFAQHSANACEFIASMVMWLGFIIVGVMLVLLILSKKFEQTVIGRVTMIAFFIIGIVMVVAGFILHNIQAIAGVFFGVVEVAGAIWDSMCIGLANAFHSAVAKCARALSGLIGKLQDVGGVMGAILSALGVKGIDTSALDKFASRHEGLIEDMPVIDGAYERGYSKGTKWGKNAQDKINAFGSNIKNMFGSGLGLPDTGGINLGDLVGGAPSSLGIPGAGVPGSGAGGGKGKGNKHLGNIDKNTGAMADSMKLTEEDMKYLRQLAEFRWMKDHTLQTINIDMTNNNNINSDSDIDGIVTRLTDKLYEELQSSPDGVYA